MFPGCSVFSANGNAMIDHICITVSDYKKSQEFYTKILATLGHEQVRDFGTSGGFGSHGKPSFWIGEGKAGDYWTDKHEAGRAPLHFAFKAESREQVDEVYRVGLELGAKDYGAPGMREHYHQDYYGAFLIDFDGNNIEAVCCDWNIPA